MFPQTDAKSTLTLLTMSMYEYVRKNIDTHQTEAEDC